MAGTPRLRRIIAASALKGYLLEEAVAYLISRAGYRLLTSKEDDPHDLDWMGNGLQVRGRGGFHQADVLGELSWAPAFGNPIRLFIEAKWKSKPGATVGIKEIRHAVGITQDINQVISTVRRREIDADERDGDDVYASGRNFCYTYRYAVCSTSGFSKGAQAYALAHQVALIDMSHDQFADLKGAIDAVGDELHSHLADLEEIERMSSRPALMRRLRATIRERLWQQGSEDRDEMLESFLQPLFAAVQAIGELFVGVSATGFVMFLRASDSRSMVRHMRADRDPHVRLYYDRRNPLDWRIHLESPEVQPCQLYFTLPEILLKALEERQHRGLQAAALNIKGHHFSRITLYRVTEEKTLVCSLRLDPQQIASARADVDDMRERRGRFRDR